MEVDMKRWQRGALYGIGAWTAFGGVSALVDPAAQAATFFTDASVVESGGGLLLLRLAYAQLLAWGVGYALAARFPAMLVPILGAGIVGKVSYAALTAIAYGTGSGTFALLLTGAGDLII